MYSLILCFYISHKCMLVHRLLMNTLWPWRHVPVIFFSVKPLSETCNCNPVKIVQLLKKNTSLVGCDRQTHSGWHLSFFSPKSLSQGHPQQLRLNCGKTRCRHRWQLLGACPPLDAHRMRRRRRCQVLIHKSVWVRELEAKETMRTGGGCERWPLRITFCYSGFIRFLYLLLEGF